MGPRPLSRFPRVEHHRSSWRRRRTTGNACSGPRPTRWRPARAARRLRGREGPVRTGPRGGPRSPVRGAEPGAGEAIARPLIGVGTGPPVGGGTTPAEVALQRFRGPRCARRRLRVRHQLESPRSIAAHEPNIHRVSTRRHIPLCGAPQALSDIQVSVLECGRLTDWAQILL